MSLNDIVFVLDSSRRPIKESDRAKIKGIYPYYGASGIIDYVNSYIFDDDLILLSEDGANILDRSTRVAFEVHGKCWINNHAHVLKAKNHNTTFISEYLESKKYDDYNTGTAQPKINQEVMKRIPLYIPEDKGEENKIGNLLSLINDRITTQNKIIEKLESLKIGIKEKIYLLGKTKEPLERILHEVSEKSTVQNQYPVLSSTVRGLFLQSEYFDRSIASDNNIGYKIVRKDQIIISPQNLWMGNLTFNERYENGIVSPSYKIYEIDSKYSKKYIYWLLTSKRSFFNYRLVSEQGASIVRRNLNIDAFMGLCLPVIKEKNDELKIEKLIGLIDKKLEDEKKRGDLLNQQKQFLLSNLFI